MGGRRGRAVTLYALEEYPAVKKLGKQVCLQLSSKVLKRTCALDSLDRWSKKIGKLNQDIKQLVVEEELQQELALVDQAQKKADNCEKYMDEIRNRPDKQWFMDSKEKMTLAKKKNSMFRLEKEIAMDLHGNPTEKAETEKRAPKMTEIEREEKTKRDKMKARAIAREKEKKEEKEQGMALSRANAKRDRIKAGKLEREERVNKEMKRFAKKTGGDIEEKKKTKKQRRR